MASHRLETRRRLVTVRSSASPAPGSMGHRPRLGAAGLCLAAPHETHGRGSRLLLGRDQKRRQGCGVSRRRARITGMHPSSTFAVAAASTCSLDLGSAVVDSCAGSSAVRPRATSSCLTLAARPSARAAERRRSGGGRAGATTTDPAALVSSLLPGEGSNAPAKLEPYHVRPKK